MPANRTEYKQFEAEINHYFSTTPLGFVYRQEAANSIKEKIRDLQKRKIDNYTIIPYENVAIHVLLLHDAGKKGWLGFAFYDSRNLFDEGELSAYLMLDEQLKSFNITEIQIKAVVNLEKVLAGHTS